MKHNEQPVFRVLQPVVLSSDRQIYLPGAIVDLSYLPPKTRKRLVEQGLFETADGEPENDPAEKAKPCKNC